MKIDYWSAMRGRAPLLCFGAFVVVVGLWSAPASARPETHATDFAIDVAALEGVSESAEKRETTTGLSAGEHQDWWFGASLYVWMQGTQGTVRSGETEIRLDGTFLDYLDHADSFGAFFGRFEARKRRFGGYIDFTYGVIGVDIDVGPLTSGAVTLPQVTGEFTATQAYTDFVGFYRAFEKSFGDAPRDGYRRGREALSVDILAGARYTHLKSELKLSANGPLTIKVGPIEITRALPGVEIEDTTNLVDPIVGGRVIYDLSNDFTLSASGDVGGFGVSSDLTWSALGLVDYRFDMFGQPSDFYVGYRALHIRYTDGSFKYDVTALGPIFGLRINF
jgi:hypothetical protein